MKMVISNARALIQLCLPHSPVLIATHAEEILRGVALGHLRQDGECSRRQRKFMQAGVLGARWGKHDHLPGEVDLVPLQCADLLPALACQEQEAEDIAEGAITACAIHRRVRTRSQLLRSSAFVVPCTGLASSSPSVTHQAKNAESALRARLRATGPDAV